MQKGEKRMKTWLITGCSSGLGHGLAKAVLKKGDQAVITARNAETLADLVKEYPDSALAVNLDVTKPEQVKAAVEQSLERFGQIDVLVNNAGYGYRSSVEEGEPEGVNLLFQTNFFGPIEMIKAVLPQMRERKSGTIVNVSSIAAVRSAVGSGYYASSKAALELMSDGLARELEPLGIHTIIVEPGAFRTKFYSTSLKGTGKKIDDYAETAGKNRVENVVDRQNQPGDPNKGAKVIIAAVEKENPPKRLLLGSDAVRIVTQELTRRLEEIETWKELSVQSDFDAQA
jgi:NAD(P)-dependent dehydrogenase (short-subunit alcohol dehydrogenase family)